MRLKKFSVQDLSTRIDSIENQIKIIDKDLDPLIKLQKQISKQHDKLTDLFN